MEGEGEDFNPGESVIKPKWTGFTYSALWSTCISPEKKLPVLKRKKRTLLKRKMQKTVNDDIDEIIEILSSPEKSPFKKDAADLLVSPLVLKKARRQLYDNTECSLQKTIAVSLDHDTESNSLPSIESQKSDNSRPSSPEELTIPQSSQSLPS